MIQHKVAWADSCCDLMLYKQNWFELDWIKLNVCPIISWWYFMCVQWWPWVTRNPDLEEPLDTATISKEANSHTNYPLSVQRGYEENKQHRTRLGTCNWNEYSLIPLITIYWGVSQARAVFPECSRVLYHIYHISYTCVTALGYLDTLDIYNTVLPLFILCCNNLCFKGL